MKKIIILLFILMQFPLVGAVNSLDSLLLELDQAVKKRDLYGEKRENRILNLKELLEQSFSDEQRFELFDKLFGEYRYYNTDSSLHYANEKLKLAGKLRNPDYLNEARLNTAEIMGMAGMYKEALDIMDSVDKNSLNKSALEYYYHIYRTVYGVMADYSVTKKEKEKYARLTNQYRDSLMLAYPPESRTYQMVKGDQLIVEGKYDEAIDYLKKGMDKLDPEDRDVAFYAYTLSEAYHNKGDLEEEKKYLAISSLRDIKLAVKEYVSLRKLAMLLYETGDLDRSYDYLKCSMEDAHFCNARFRAIEIADIFPIIDQAYLMKTGQQKREIVIALICISVLSLFLLITIFYIYRQMKKLAAARHELSGANNHLHDLNGELKRLNDELLLSNDKLRETNLALSDTNYIKEEYVGRYMDLCSVYLDKMDVYQRRLNKIAASGKLEELQKAIRSSQIIDDELKEFYAQFDNSFLQLFPDFVDEFNALLVENEKIVLKPGELLNTELRIFALIRLGITDSVKIAQFLRYSVTTIYNYRTKVRNKAAGERNEFEQKVMKIGTVSA